MSHQEFTGSGVYPLDLGVVPSPKTNPVGPGTGVEECIVLCPNLSYTLERFRSLIAP